VEIAIDGPIGGVVPEPMTFIQYREPMPRRCVVQHRVLVPIAPASGVAAVEADPQPLAFAARCTNGRTAPGSARNAERAPPFGVCGVVDVGLRCGAEESADERVEELEAQWTERERELARPRFVYRRRYAKRKSGIRGCEEKGDAAEARVGRIEWLTECVDVKAIG
jgi:hypothetical protein